MKNPNGPMGIEPVTSTKCATAYPARRIHLCVLYGSQNKEQTLAYTTSTDWFGRAMAQAVSRRPLSAEARVRSRVSPCEIRGGQSGTGTGFSPSTSAFYCQFHSIGAPLH